ncbi:hypothetical protein MFIFM68171_02058 [Madurella fahalii]|uniref:Actin-like ATPase domain-containing protein n=1 Tax=Madurella fahalii TaxID=1157608 RepID=A0ABQ0G261_9PEZI
MDLRSAQRSVDTGVITIGIDFGPTMLSRGKVQSITYRLVSHPDQTSPVRATTDRNAGDSRWPSTKKRSDGLNWHWPIQTSSPTTSASDIVVAYLRALWNRTLACVADRLGLTLEQLARSPLHVVLGVPAIWLPDTLLRLREAVDKAGILNPPQHQQQTVTFFSEPETATLSLVDVGVIPVNLNGDMIIVCDCGGGTADAIALEILGMAPLALRECVPGDGRFCGPVLLDDAYLELVERKIQMRSSTTLAATITKPMLREFFGDWWERQIKIRFNGTNSPYSKPLPFQLTNATERRSPYGSTPPTITLISEEIKSIFDPAVDKIVDLLKSQMDAVLSATRKPPKAVVLAGGFSGNPYLRSRLADQIGQWSKRFNFPDEIRLHYGQQEQSMLAVAHGCLLQALQQINLRRPAPVSVVSHVARASYGYVRNGNTTSHGNNVMPFHQFVTKGEDLPAAGELKRVQVDVTALGPVTLTGDMGLAIYRSSEPEMMRGTLRRYCDIVWTKAGTQLLEREGDASDPVGLTLDVEHAGDSAFFGVRVNGVPQGREHVKIVYT